MTKIKFTLQAAALVLFTLAFTSFAQAQATRTWVSGVGDDVNPCSRTAPCKTFAGAISKTAANGEINTLDPGGFGTLTATKSITVDGETSGKGGVLAALTTGFIINDSATGTPNTIQVILRHLSIDGAGNGTDGIRFLSGRRLIVEHCIIFGFTDAGIETAPSTGTLFNLTVNNTSIFRNGTGIRQATTIGTLNASYDNVTLNNNIGDGMTVTGGTANLSRSVVDANGGHGINVSGGAIVNANDNQITSNVSNGINNASPSTVRISNNNIHRNANGLAGNGTYQSFGDNKVIGNNTTDVAVGTTVTNVAATNLR